MRKKNIFCIFFALIYSSPSAIFFFFLQYYDVQWSRWLFHVSTKDFILLLINCRSFISKFILKRFDFDDRNENGWHTQKKRKKKEIEFENIEFGACTSHFFSFPPCWMEPFLRWAFQLQFETRIFFFFFKSKHRAMDHFCRCWGHS